MRRLNRLAGEQSCMSQHRRKIEVDPELVEDGPDVEYDSDPEQLTA